jgi:cytochrome c oxidase subunit 2
VYGQPVQLEDGRTVTADENYLRECILDPGAKRVKGFQPIMPTFQGLVSEEQVNALVAYIKSISASKSAGGAKTSASLALPRRSQTRTETSERAQAQPNAQPNRSQVQ